MDVFKPSTSDELHDVVGWALAESKKLRIQGQNSKSGLGRPIEADAIVDLSGQSGITLYEPGELILRAKAGTPLQEIDKTLTDAGQQLAFEPPRWGALYGSQDGGTLGGLVATNLSGARRVKAGALRDHLLGVEAVSGRNEAFKSGGRVMKNVSGYDLPKLMAGSYGTLGILTELTVKVMPAAEKVRTLMIAGASGRNAQALMTAAMQSPLEVSGAAHLPKVTVAMSALPEISGIDQGLTLLRLEGYATSIGARVKALQELVAQHGVELKPLSGHAGVTVLDDTTSLRLWREVSDVSFFAKSDFAIWRVSTAPTHLSSIVATVGADAWYCDWAGGLIWLAVAPEGAADADLVRQAVNRAGGHATLIRAPEAIRQKVSVFHPQNAVAATLTQNIKNAFDPQKILNCGRMYADV